MENAYEIVRNFEKAMKGFVGSPYAVAVDSCTNALFLCCVRLEIKEVFIPKKTYVSVANSIIHAGGKVRFTNQLWSGQYQLKPYPIYDSACQLSKNMYTNNTFQCVSFSANKVLPIGKGGMIFTDSAEAAEWFKLARYEGRQEIPIHEQKDITVLGWNMYMTPEQAARGLTLLSYLPNDNIIHMDYPDLSTFSAFKS